MDWQQAERGGYIYRWFGAPGWPPRPDAESKVAVWLRSPPWATDFLNDREAVASALPGLSTRTRMALLRAGYSRRVEVADLAGGRLGGGYGLSGVRNLGAKGQREVLAWLGPLAAYPPPPLPFWVGEE